MDITIPYGKQAIPVKIPVSCEILEPTPVVCPPEDILFQEALNQRQGSLSFQEFLSHTDNLLIVVNDATRPTPTATVLQHLYSKLSNLSHVSFIVATGSHRPPTPKELQRIFGSSYNKRAKHILINEAKKEDKFEKLGTTPRGTRVSMNKNVVDCDNILTINSVEPHYFAGYTGGRKSFLPGVSSYETIEMNHKFALDRKARTLALKDNPIHLDMMDAIQFVAKKNIFSLQIVLTPEGKTYRVTSGGIIDSFEAAIPPSKEVFCTPLKRKANIVLTVAPQPMDIDLYQSQKALENGKLALEDDGIIILVSECPSGVGPDSFLELLARGKTAEEVLDLLSEGYKLGYHKAGKIAELASRAAIYAVTSLDEETVKQAHMQPFKSVQSSLQHAITTVKKQGKKPHVAVLPAGSLTVPHISDETNCS